MVGAQAHADEAAGFTDSFEKVAGFDLRDEPYWRGVSPEDLASAARTIKETFPDMRVVVEAAPAVTATMEIPAEVDRVGFDQCCDSISAVARPRGRWRPPRRGRTCSSSPRPRRSRPAGRSPATPATPTSPRFNGTTWIWPGGTRGPSAP